MSLRNTSPPMLLKQKWEEGGLRGEAPAKRPYCPTLPDAHAGEPPHSPKRNIARMPLSNKR